MAIIAHRLPLILGLGSYLVESRRVTARDRQSERLSNGYVSPSLTVSEPNFNANIPDLGDLTKNYQVDTYVARGGQAEVWKGVDLKTNKPVALRFPRALCENKFCKVSEIDPLTVREMNEACSLATLARQKLDLEQRRHPREIGALIPDGFSTCLHGLSSKMEHAAFEVWTWAGTHTLTEAFFQQTGQGAFTIEAKRHILSELMYLVSTMHDASLSKDQRCCCSENSHNTCRYKGKASKCPKGYDHVETRFCGEIVHHDLKFDNVMINSLHPMIVDFGAAVHCSQENAKGYSSDWVPPWQQHDALGFSQSLCWSYDTYGIGVIWLVTELLRELSSSHLLCIAAKNAGLSQIPPSTDVEEGIYNNSIGFQNEGQEVLWLEGCGYFPVNKELRDAASEQIAYLVSDLRKHVLVSEHVATVLGFTAALHAFVADRAKLSKQVRHLDLLVPDFDSIKANIFPLLHGCPPLFGKHGRMFENEEQRVLECRQRRSSSSLRMAIENGQTDIVGNLFRELQAVCTELQAITVYHGNVSTRSSKHQCEQDEINSLIMQITKKDAQGIKMMLLVSENVVKGKAYSIVNHITPGGESLLALAAQTRQVEIVALLLEYGADPLMVQENGPKSNASYGGSIEGGPLPALFVAATLPRNEEVLNLLLREVVLKKGVEPLLEFDLLGLVAQHGDAGMMRLCLEYLRGPPRDLGEIWPRNCLPQALAGKQCHVIFGPASGRWEAPLLIAARSGHAAACELLLQAGAEIEVRDKMNWSVVALAVQSGSVESVQVLRNKGCKLTKVPKIGSLLHLAVKNRHVAMVELLVDMGISRSDVNTQGDTPLHIAMRTPGIDLRIIDRLGGEVQAYSIRNADEQTPLETGLSMCVNPAALKRLLKAGEKLDRRMMRKQRKSAFPFAAAMGQAPCLPVLAQSASTEDVSHAFRVAAFNGQVHVMRALGRVGCLSSDIPVAMSIGRGPNQMRYPVRETFKELVALCGRNSLGQQDFYGMNALSRWAYEGDITMLQEILHFDRQLCNATLKPVDYAPQPFFKSIGPIRGLTPLSFVRLRIRWIESNFNYLADMNGEMYYFDKDNRRFSQSISQRQFIRQLLDAQRVLEDAGCDGQESEHQQLS